MDKKAKKRRFYTFMIIPHDAAGRTIGLKIPAVWIYTLVGLALFSVLIVGSSVIYSSLLSRKLVDYANALSKNQEQQRVIDNFSLKTDKVNKAIQELVHEDNQLRKMLGLGSWQSKIKLSGDPKQPVSPDSKVDKISSELKLADNLLVERRQSLQELKSWVNEVRSRLANTPSSWPIYGRIVSRFGYRVYPWRGMHYGIDISSSYGAPVRATADGVVEFTGWRSGYGKTVIVRHGYGVASLYAHNSKFAVAPGQKVRKGQVICYVGTTGYSTGPHVHYEVRKWDKPVNPIAYLDLNIMSASKIWRQ